MTDKKPVPRRLYIVTDQKGDSRLVNAATPAQAIQHIYEPEIRIATALDAFNLSLTGAKIEEAA